MKDPNERRAMIAIGLSLAVFYVWSMIFAPPPPPAVEPEAVVAAAPAVSAAPAPVPVASAEPCASVRTPFASSEVAMQAEACGGGLVDLSFPAVHAPLAVSTWWGWLYDTVTGGSPGPWRPYVAQEGPERLVGEQGRFAAAGRGSLSPQGTWTVVSQDPLVLRSASPDGFVVTETIARTADPGVFDVKVRFESATPLLGPFWVGVVDRYADQEGAYDSRPKLAAVLDADYEPLPQPSEIDGVEIAEGPLSWFGVADRYFLAALVPNDPSGLTLQYARVDSDRVGAFGVLANQSLDPASPIEVSFLLYAGAKDVERLNGLGHELEAAVELGIFAFFSKILLFFLHIFHNAMGNWGLSIIALTFLVRISFYPLSARAFKSAKRMQAVQPLLKELQEKYKDDKDAQTRETMALFKKHDVNPLGGCLPLLLQMPVFFALYSALLYTPDLFHADFLHVQDLSAPDPFGALPFFMAIGMILQQRMTPMTGMDPQQAAMMKWMPVIFALFMFGLPAGLSLYYAVNTVLSIAQQWYNTRSPPEPAPLGEVNVHP